MEMVVNVDLYSWTTPNPDRGYGEPHDVVHAAPRGETIDVTTKEAERGMALRVMRHYGTVVEGGSTVARLEPALVMASAVNGVAASTAEAVAAIPGVEAQLAALRLKAVGTPFASPRVTATPVVLPPSVTGVAFLGAIDAQGRAESGPGMAGAIDSADPERLKTLRVEELMAHLGQHPEDVDLIDRLEGERSGGRRTTVDKAVEALRTRAAE